MVKSVFPTFKKKVVDFLSQEDGKITKQSAIALGAFIFGGTLASLKDVSAAFTHGNQLNGSSFTSATGVISVTHVHHGSHSSY